MAGNLAFAANGANRCKVQIAVTNVTGSSVVNVSGTLAGLGNTDLWVNVSGPVDTPVTNTIMTASSVAGTFQSVHVTNQVCSILALYGTTDVKIVLSNASAPAGTIYLLR